MYIERQPLDVEVWFIYYYHCCCCNPFNLVEMLSSERHIHHTHNFYWCVYLYSSMHMIFDTLIREIRTHKLSNEKRLVVVMSLFSSLRNYCFMMFALGKHKENIYIYGNYSYVVLNVYYIELDLNKLRVVNIYKTYLLWLTWYISCCMFIQKRTITVGARKRSILANSTTLSTTEMMYWISNSESLAKRTHIQIINFFVGRTLISTFRIRIVHHHQYYFVL